MYIAIFNVNNYILSDKFCLYNPFENLPVKLHIQDAFRKQW